MQRSDAVVREIHEEWKRTTHASTVVCVCATAESTQTATDTSRVSRWATILLWVVAESLEDNEEEEGRDKRRERRVRLRRRAVCVRAKR